MAFDVEEKHNSSWCGSLGRPKLRVPSADNVGHVFNRPNSSEMCVFLCLVPMSLQKAVLVPEHQILHFVKIMVEMCLGISCLFIAVRGFIAPLLFTLDNLKCEW